MKNTLCFKKRTLCCSCESKGYSVKEDTTQTNYLYAIAYSLFNPSILK